MGFNFLKLPHDWITIFILKAIGVTEMFYVSNDSWKKLCTPVLKLLFRKYNEKLKKKILHMMCIAIKS